MAFTTEEQKIYDHVKGALPEWWFTGIAGYVDPEEFLGALVKVFDRVRTHRETLLDQTYILTADDGIPDWLGELARDRNTRRQESEGTDEFRQRLRSVVDLVTPDAVEAAVNAMLAAAGVAGECTLLDLRTGRAHAGNYTPLGGVGGEITAHSVAGQWRFEPSVSPPGAPTPPAIEGQDALELIACPTAGNDGVFTILDHYQNAYVYANPSGVAENAPSNNWGWLKRDVDQELVDTFNRGFMSRGYRMGTMRWTLVVMLPFGTSAGLAASVVELLRQVKGAGIKIIVERRQSP